MSKAPFLFPIRAGDIALLCHPDPTHPLAAPHFIDGDLTAGNGYFATKARRGLWLESDFTPAEYEAKERLSNLPWHNVPETDHPDWQSLDDIRGMLYRFGWINPWTDKHRPAPCPIWKLGHSLIRLSHLQLIARLPKAQVYAGHLTVTCPAFFRFNDGYGIIPQDRSLKAYSREIFAPQYDMFTGALKERTAPRQSSYTPKPVPEQPIDNWPPIDQSEF